MPRKSPDGDGYIRKRKVTRKDGSTYIRYIAVISAGYDKQGVRKRKEGSWRATEKEALTDLKTLRKQLDAGQLNREEIILQDYAETFLKQAKNQLEPNSFKYYDKYYNQFIKDSLGSLKITPQTLSLRRIKNWRNDIADAVSNDAANRAKQVLGLILNEAIEDGILEFNAAQAIRKLKHKKNEPAIWSSEEIKAILEAALDTRFYGYIYLNLATGLRTEEILGLRWSRIHHFENHQDAGEVQVDSKIVNTGRKLELIETTKSDAGYRAIGFAQDTADVISQHQDFMKFFVKDNQMDLFFPSQNGNPMHYSNVRRDFLGIVEKADVKTITLHGLRHTFASMRIAAGMNAVELARVMGHSDPSFTYRVYGHLFERANRESAPKLEDLL